MPPSVASPGDRASAINCGWMEYNGANGSFALQEQVVGEPKVTTLRYRVLGEDTIAGPLPQNYHVPLTETFLNAPTPWQPADSMKAPVQMQAPAQMQLIQQQQPIANQEPLSCERTASICNSFGERTASFDALSLELHSLAAEKQKIQVSLAAALKAAEPAYNDFTKSRPVTPSGSQQASPAASLTACVSLIVCPELRTDAASGHALQIPNPHYQMQQVMEGLGVLQAGSGGNLYSSSSSIFSNSQQNHNGNYPVPQWSSQQQVTCCLSANAPS